MPDPTNDLNIVVRTEADTAKLREFEAQLQRDIANAKRNEDAGKPDENFSDEPSREELMKRLGISMEPDPNAQPPRPVAGIGGVIIGVVQDAIRAAQKALGVGPSATQKPNQNPDTGKTNTASTNTPPVLPRNPLLQNPTNAPTGGETNQPVTPLGPPSTNFPIGPFTTTIPAPSSSGTDTGAGSIASIPYGSNEDLTNAASQTQSLQASSQRLSSAIAQNTAATNSLLSRTLDLIDQQNRKLSDVDRKIAELGNQIKSLKNP